MRAERDKNKSGRAQAERSTSLRQASQVAEQVADKYKKLMQPEVKPTIQAKRCLRFSTYFNNVGKDSPLERRVT